jgi:uncharacterized protein
MVQPINEEKMKLFLDSGIFIEYLKGRKIDFYEFLIQQDYELFINQVVFSEFLYYFIGTVGNKSPLAIKESGRLPDCLKDRNPIDMIPGVQVLNHNSGISQSAIDIIKQFNLLPNDALILATCKYFDIKYLATFDSDFEVPCNSLGIRIFNDKSELKVFIHG